MNAFHVFGLVVLLHVTAVASAAWLLIRMAGNRSAVQYAIGVGGLLLILNSPNVVLLLPSRSWLHASSARPPIKVASPTKNVVTAIRSGDELFAADDVAVVHNATLRNAPETVADERQPTLRPTNLATLMPMFTNGLFGMWLLGSLLSAYRLWKSRRELWSLPHSSTLFSDAVLLRVERDVCLALGVEQLPEIRVSPLAPIPLVLGVWRPVVILPGAFAEEANDESLRDVLIHECAHIVRRDPWVHSLQQIAGIVFWIHPAVYWLNRRISRAREELCDNFVIRGSDPADYSQTLLSFAEPFGQRQELASTLGLFSTRWTLEDRIRDLLDSERKTMTETRAGTKWGLGILFVAISCLIGGVGRVGVSYDQPPATPPASTAVDAPRETPKEEAEPVLEEGKLTIRGECFNEDLKPIPKVALRAYHYQSAFDPPVLVASAETDQDGRFNLVYAESLVSRDPKNRLVQDLVITAKATGYVAKGLFKVSDQVQRSPIEIELSSKPQALSGTVTDTNGKPVSNVLVSPFPFYPPPGFQSAITDKQGKFEIADMEEWNSHVQVPNSKRTLRLRHADYPLSRANFTRVPQRVNVTLKPPSIVEGRVIDTTTNQPVPNVPVRAQGIARHGYFRTMSDANGHYQLQMTKDHYNISAEVDDRISIAEKAIEAVPGKTTSDVDIKMVRGAIIFGALINGMTNQPIPTPEGQTRHVAHHGPAFPFAGSAVGSTKVNADGTYRLRVAPGRNYVYYMNGDMFEYVTVEDGAEIKLDLVSGEKRQRDLFSSEPDLSLQSKLTEDAEREDAEEAAANENR